LKEYLIDMQTQGYTIIAVEQTVNSQNLYEFQFPEKTLLLLGYEKLIIELINCEFFL
jgi:tRNA G18 (ribose-2'-O)-methylase SpoU